MPIYEYVCETDGSVLEVQRPMADADKPLEDPEGKGRTFTRKFSTFSTKSGGAGGAGGAAAAGASLPTCCPCGKPGGGACGLN